MMEGQDDALLSRINGSLFLPSFMMEGQDDALILDPGPILATFSLQHLQQPAGFLLHLLRHRRYEPGPVWMPYVGTVVAGVGDVLDVDLVLDVWDAAARDDGDEHLRHVCQSL